MAGLLLDFYCAFKDWSGGFSWTLTPKGPAMGKDTSMIDLLTGETLEIRVQGLVSCEPLPARE